MAWQTLLRGIRARDVVLAAGVALLIGGITVAGGVALGLPTAPVVAVTLAMIVLVGLRHSAPLASAVGIYLVALVQWIMVGQVVPIDVVVLIALYSVTAHGPKRAGILALGGALIGSVMFAISVTRDVNGGVLDLVGYAVMVALVALVVWALGMVRRARLERLAALEERARALEKERHNEAALAVAAERARIAREMHDIVAHSLAVIIAQADGGRYAGRADPEAATKSLDTIAEIGRDALADIRRILGVLRSTDGDAAVVLPQPTNDDLEAVIDRIRAAGARVAYTQLGESRPLLPGMGLTIQRVCQEALTNCLKHAGDTAAISVLLHWQDGQVVLQVDDDGRGAAAISDGAGSGLVGMRERAALFGGQVQAGPRRAGGYRVVLTLPLRPRPTSPVPTHPTTKEPR